MAVANELEELGREERDRLRIVEPQASGEPLLRENARPVEDELVEVARGEVQASPLSGERVVAEEGWQGCERFADSTRGPLRGDGSDPEDGAVVPERARGVEAVDAIVGRSRPGRVGAR